MTSERFKLIVAVYVLLEEGNHVFLLRRHNTGWADGWYTLPAGHAERGELLEETAIRELREETGVTALVQDLSLVHLSHHIYGQSDQCVDFFFKCRTWQGQPVNAESGKADQGAWFARDALPSPLLRNVRDALSASGVALKEYPLHPDEDMARM